MDSKDLFHLMDVMLEKMYETFGKPNPRKPGADETPPRNYFCAACGEWFATEHIIECGGRP